MDAIINALQISAALGIAAGILAAFAALPWKRADDPPQVFITLATLLIGAAFIAALLASEGWPGWKPKESWWSLLHIAAVGTVIPAVGAALPTRWSLAPLVAVLATAVAAALLLRTPTIVEQPWIWRLVLGGGIVVGWMVLEPLAKRHRGALMPFGLSFVFIALFVLVLGRMGFARAAPGLSAAAAALGMITIGAWIKPRVRISRGVITTALTLGAGSLVIAWMNAGTSISGTPAWTPLVVVGSPLALWLAEVPAMRKAPPWMRTGIAVLITACLAGGAVAVAMAMQEPDSYAGY